MFVSCVFRKPNDGGSGFRISASFVVWKKLVNSMPRRSPRMPASNPSSISFDVSGPRFGSPRLLGVTAGWPFCADVGVYVRSAANCDGACPDVPHTNFVAY